MKESLLKVGQAVSPAPRLLSALIALVLAGVLLAAPRQRLPQKYSDWLNRDVVYIITNEEKKAFLALETDAQRDKFIEDFWEIRNTARGSGSNPYKEEHYRRIQYANEHFGLQTRTPGWMTDMGRTYILFGKPASRASYIGYGQIYPLELWYYSNNTGNPALPSFFYVLFFIPEDIGEYRFYHPFIDGPMKLVRGSQFNTNRDVYNFLKPLSGELARAAFTLIPGDPLDTQDFQPSMAAEMLVNKIQNLANDSFNVQRIRAARELRAQVSSWFLVGGDRPLDVSDLVLRDFAGSYWLDYAVWIDDPALGHEDRATGELAVDCRLHLLSEGGTVVVEDQELSNYKAFEKTDSGLSFRPFLLAGRLPLIPGKFKLQVELVNRQSGRVYHAERPVVVENAGQVSISGLMLAASAEKAAHPAAGTPFQFFGAQFRPAQAGRLPAGGSMVALFQVQAPPSGPQAYEIDYLLANVQMRDTRSASHEVVPVSAFRDGTLIKAKTFSLQGLEPGNYRFVVSVRAQGSQEVLASAGMPFHIAEGINPAALFFLSHSKGISTPAVAAYLRGLEWLSVKDEEHAAQSLREALEANPSNQFAGRALAQIYFNQQRYPDLASLYRQVGLSPFKSAPETMAQVALSLWRAGDSPAAATVLEAAQTSFPKNELLAAAARQSGLAAPSTDLRGR